MFNPCLYGTGQGEFTPNGTLAANIYGHACREIDTMNGLNQSGFLQYALQYYKALRAHLRRLIHTLQWRSDRSRVWRWVSMTMVMVMAIATTGCSLDSFKSKEATQIPRIVTSTISDPKTFNPITNDVSTIIFGLMYSSLLVEDGESGELEPTLAEKWVVSEDQKEIVFTLKEDLKWSDGEPFTVEDILFTYNDILFNPKIPSGIRDILRIGEQGLFPSVTKVGDRQVKFTVPEPFAPFLRYAGGISIMPKHALEKAVNTMGSDDQPEFLSTWGTDTDPAKIIGNGPYRLLSYSPGQRMIFERNPYYWKNDTKTEGEALQPYVERLIQQIVESIDSSLLQFRSGGIDVMGLTPEQFSLLKRETKKGKFTIYNDDPRPGSSFITFNLNTGKRDGEPLVDPAKSRWFNSREFRQAVAYTIDRQTMINNLYQGLGRPQNSPIAVQSPYYLKDGKQYDYDPQKAKDLLLSAGFSYNGENQLVDAEGNQVRFTLITNSGNTLREKMGAQIKQDLSGIGIQVDFQPIAFNTLVDKAANTLDWDCILLGFGGGTEPNGGANVWKTEGTLHMFNQNAPEGETPLTDRQVSPWEKDIEALYIKGAQELEEEKRKAIYGEAQQLIQENVPFIYLVNPLSLIAIRDRIQGVKYTARYSSPLSGALWNIDDLTIAIEE